MKRILQSFALVVICLGITAKADAAFLDLAPPGKTPFFATNVGDARSFIFDAVSGFTMTSVGIRMDPLVANFNLTAELFSITPATFSRASLLASNGPVAF